MKVLMLKDVKSLGKKDEIKDVNDGHAINFLIPRKLAKIATQNVLKDAELRHQDLQNKENLKRDLIDKTIHSLATEKVSLSLRANDKGHLFKAVHESEIVKAVKEQLNIKIEESWIDIPKGVEIKSVGVHTITIKSGKSTGTLNLLIVAEK